ncbi:MAG: T9SS type A sorting domain-containing protein [Candidatus Eisenbacteria bacterium]|nr:T9SS type A sorting domain-containing protein [Candidatus Eisenbacteria bacterium]
MKRMKWMVGALLLLTVAAADAQITDEALLDSLQRTAFDFFWNEANPTTGLIRDRSASWSPCSIASTGFGLTAICIGIEHGWITREQGRERILAALRTFWNAPQGSGSSGFAGYKGLFYHFLTMDTAERTWDCELSTIDTALLFAGIFDAKEYFDGTDSLDVEVRSLADSITTRAEWDWIHSGWGIRMGWKPDTGFSGYGDWIGYNEAMILYIIALGSPTHPVPAYSWTAWTSGYDWRTNYGYTYVEFPPLFGHQYSHCWIDFRCIQDAYMQSKGIDYFENSRRATLAQRAYCIDNPGNHIGYSDSLWGITAGDGPFGYTARGAPPGQNDDGTITPSATVSSLPFAPEVVMAATRNMYNAYGSQLWMEYGFRDGFNLNYAWWGPDVIGISEGPILLMIENYLNGSVWSRFTQNDDIRAGLEAAGFTGCFVAVDGPAEEESPTALLAGNRPNPFRGETTIWFRMPERGSARLTVYNVAGREVARLFDGERSAGFHQIEWNGAGLPSGVYYYRLQTETETFIKRCVLLR